ncbi:hypothetical protein H4S08_003044 [Coemansia sp. RSA 1365]|nr:hypothetical protein H4S08_003044 [Coemansia sp. RSA 1365]
MVQDPSYGEELHLTIARVLNSETGEVRQRFSQYTDVDHSLEEGWEVDYSSTGNVFTEKEVAYCVSVPGQNQWAQLESTASIESALEALSITNTSPHTNGNVDSGDTAESGSEVASGLASKYPLPGENHTAALVKFYSPSVAPKASSVIDVVGIYELGYNSKSQESDEERKVLWPCIHAIYHTDIQLHNLVPSLPRLVLSDYIARRDMCLSHLTLVLGGDELAAQYLLLHLLSKSVRVQDAKVGKFSLNLIGVPSCEKEEQQPRRFNFNNLATKWIGDAIAQVVPCSVEIPFELELLNRSAFLPNAEHGDLKAGILQLASGTEIICDETCLYEGTLDEHGVRNLHALQTCILEQTVTYLYPFQPIDIPTNLRILVLSTGKSILQNDCDVYLADTTVRFLTKIQSGTSIDIQPLDPMHTEQIRQYLELARCLDFSIPKDVSDVISSEYADSRRSAHKNGEQMMTQEELALTVTVARLISISKGQDLLDLASWREACALEQYRKERATKAKDARPATGSEPPS